MHFAKTIDKRSYFKTSGRAQILISDHLTKRQIKLSIFSAFYFDFFFNHFRVLQHYSYRIMRPSIENDT